MTTRTPYDLIRKAIAARLIASTAVTVKRVYRNVTGIPTAVVFPYYVILGVTGTPHETQTTTGTEATVTIKAVSRTATGSFDADTAETMMDAATQALTETAMTLTGHAVIDCRRDFDTINEYGDDAYHYREGVVRFRILTTYTGA